MKRVLMIIVLVMVALSLSAHPITGKWKSMLIKEGPARKDVTILIFNFHEDGRTVTLESKTGKVLSTKEYIYLEEAGGLVLMSIKLAVNFAEDGNTLITYTLPELEPFSIFVRL